MLCCFKIRRRWNIQGNKETLQFAGQGGTEKSSSLKSWPSRNHMGLEHASREKKLPMVIFSIFVHKNVYRIRFQEIKIGPWEGFEKKAFFSLFLMRKRLSSGQKWFLRPYFPLIRGMFLLKSGLRFSFWALEVPEPRVRKRPLSPTNRAFSSLSVRALRPFLNTNIPLNSGKYCFRNHFWPPEKSLSHE